MSTHRLVPAAADVRAAVVKAAFRLSDEEIRSASSPSLLSLLPEDGPLIIRSVDDEAMASGNRVALFANIHAVDESGRTQDIRVHISWINYFQKEKILLELDRILDA